MVLMMIAVKLMNRTTVVCKLGIAANLNETKTKEQNNCNCLFRSEPVLAEQLASNGGNSKRDLDNRNSGTGLS